MKHILDPYCYFNTTAVGGRQQASRRRDGTRKRPLAGALLSEGRCVLYERPDYLLGLHVFLRTLREPNMRCWLVKHRQSEPYHRHVWGSYFFGRFWMNWFSPAGSGPRMIFSTRRGGASAISAPSERSDWLMFYVRLCILFSIGCREERGRWQIAARKSNGAGWFV